MNLQFAGTKEQKVSGDVFPIVPLPLPLQPRFRVKARLTNAPITGTSPSR